MQYVEWNQVLLTHFFNEANGGKEINTLFADQYLLDDMQSDGFNNFIQAIEKQIPGDDEFFDEFDRLVNESLKAPKFFGFLEFLILACTEGEDEDFNIDNIYGRINRFAASRLGPKWSAIGSRHAKENLEPAWRLLQDWSSIMNKGRLGIFKLIDISYKTFARRISRHVVVNQGHLVKFLDILIEHDIPPQKEQSLAQLEDLLDANLHKLKIAPAAANWIKTDTNLKRNILGLLRDYISDNYTDRTRPTKDSAKSRTPVLLKTCFNLPSGFSRKVDSVWLRAASFELKDDSLIISNQYYDIKYDQEGLSMKIEPPNIDMQDKIEYSSQLTGQKFVYCLESKWFMKNHSIGEWIETNRPHNGMSVLLLCKSSQHDQIESLGIKSKCYQFVFPNWVILKFDQLESGQFRTILLLAGFEDQLEGRILLLGNFLSRRRSIIFKEFEYHFEYQGDLARPILAAMTTEDNRVHQMVAGETTNKEDVVTNRWHLPPSFPLDQDFKVIETTTNLKSHLTYQLSGLPSAPRIPLEYLLKDKDGTPISRADSSDSIDIPPIKSQNENSSLIKLKGNYLKFYRSFGLYAGKAVFDYNRKDKGNLLLSYSVTDQKITTTDFYQLVQTLVSSASADQAKRTLYYWRSLGYVDFVRPGSQVLPNPPTLIFQQTHIGIKTFLAGYRNDALVDALQAKCKNLGLQLITEKHFQGDKYLFPQKFIIYDAYADNLKKFQQLCQDLPVRLASSSRIYQVAALQYQLPASDFLLVVRSKPEYCEHHYRKQYFGFPSLKWEESTEEIVHLEQPVIIRYNGFIDKSTKYVFYKDGKQYLLQDPVMAIFYLLWRQKINVLFKSLNGGYETSDFYVPFRLYLPYWIEKALVMSNANIPQRRKIGGKEFRVYERIPNQVVEEIARLLSQNVAIIKP